MNELLLSSLRKLESLKEGLHTYAYDTGEWIEISIDDYDLYRDNQKFKEVSKEIRNDFMDKFKLKVVFVYRKAPDNILEDFKKKLKDKGKELIECH